MTDKFKAIVLNQSSDKFTREIKTLEKSFFKTGDVMVKIDYSSLNYKDALILKNGGKLVKEYPPNHHQSKRRDDDHRDDDRRHCPESRNRTVDRCTGNSLPD